jgi:hypothetical protein
VENYSARTVDQGAANTLEALPRVKYLPFAVESATPVNLLPNSYFKNWREGAPVGWSGGHSFIRSRETRGGAAFGLKVIAREDNPTIACTVAGRGAAASRVTIGRLQGKIVTAGVWVRSSRKGMGALRISVDGVTGGTFGRDSYSGNGSWQFLTAFAKVPEDASFVSLQLRAFDWGAGSGEAFFSDPILVEGAHLPQPAPAVLDDSNVKLAGPLIYNTPIILERGDRRPSVGDGNVFTTRNDQRTVLSGFRDGQPGQTITVIFGDGMTTVDFTSPELKGNRGSRWEASVADHMTCVYDGDKWVCAISENTSRTRASTE